MYTLEKYVGAKRGNYCTLPTKDVLILDNPRQCGHPGCPLEVAYQPHPRGGLGEWEHLVAGVGPSHYPYPATRCTYCGTQDPEFVTFVQAVYSDETRCTRCGGVDGYAIGD